jgi:hypothetical protein
MALDTYHAKRAYFTMLNASQRLGSLKADPWENFRAAAAKPAPKMSK